MTQLHHMATWSIAWWHQAITYTNVDFSLASFFIIWDQFQNECANYYSAWEDEHIFSEIIAKWGDTKLTGTTFLLNMVFTFLSNLTRHIQHGFEYGIVKAIEDIVFESLYEPSPFCSDFRWKQKGNNHNWRNWPERGIPWQALSVKMFSSKRLNHAFIAQQLVGISSRYLDTRIFVPSVMSILNQSVVSVTVLAVMT